MTILTITQLVKTYTYDQEILEVMLLNSKEMETT